ncbi:hypothetical protein NDU88_000236 [Pleurodeles waltl]|uniref:Uncharacterized protein n=1 Tax=Pleurodeles waltl TaxID=8319 RepID=A0AAV7KQ51_PLEWA|nr:hypothetical protein NDU88_000236 [Pleurodeles waltl]
MVLMGHQGADPVAVTPTPCWPVCVSLDSPTRGIADLQSTQELSSEHRSARDPEPNSEEKLAKTTNQKPSPGERPLSSRRVLKGGTDPL